MKLRIVQWTTGNVGRQSATAIAANPWLELVGCYAWSPDKVGRDVGELCGLNRLGVTATDEVECEIERLTTTAPATTTTPTAATNSGQRRRRHLAGADSAVGNVDSGCLSRGAASST